MLTIDALKESLLQIVDNIDKGNSAFSDEEMIKEGLELINLATNTQNKLSKYQACKFLHVSRATFDNWVRDGKLPKGEKQQGFKELFWEMKTLKEFKDTYKNNSLLK